MLGVALLFTFQHPPIEAVQHGYRGTGMQVNYIPADINAQYAANKLPGTLPPLHAGPPARLVYKNVQVLGDLDVGRVHPADGLDHHLGGANAGLRLLPFAQQHGVRRAVYEGGGAADAADDAQHQRKLDQSHVENVAVTCYTCHRGNPVPANLFYHNPGPSRFTGMAETQTGMGTVSAAAGGASLPYDPFTPFLEGDANIRVQGTTALPDGNLSSIKQTEWTYALMMHMATSLGVNCTYCHNSRSLGDWSQSSPQRVTAWYGIRMVRDLNNNYLDPLHDVFPPARLGPMGDGPKLDCATCHQGVYKPLFGVSPIVGFPELASGPVGPPGVAKP